MPIVDLLDKDKYLPQKKIDARLDICLGRNSKKRCTWCTKLINNCRQCFCFVEQKAKLATEHCPLNKWPGDL